VWIGNRGTWFGIRTAQSRGVIHFGRNLTKRPGGKEAPASHHHPGVCAQKRNDGRVWHHGRMESIAGPRAICGESGGLQDEYSSGARSAPFYQTNLRWLRRRNGKSFFTESTG